MPVGDSASRNARSRLRFASPPPDTSTASPSAALRRRRSRSAWARPRFALRCVGLGFALCKLATSRFKRRSRRRESKRGAGSGCGAGSGSSRLMFVSRGARVRDPRLTVRSLPTFLNLAAARATASALPPLSRNAAAALSSSCAFFLRPLVVRPVIVLPTGKTGVTGRGASSGTFNPKSPGPFLASARLRRSGASRRYASLSWYMKSSCCATACAARRRCRAARRAASSSSDSAGGLPHVDHVE
mmetsp:Transcript_23701/g.70996  ORF Transcript_23701/g.70996 Transcript_23701/m.70996 type:complete len:244 (-) Transcript_23701:35-766(-)